MPILILTGLFFHWMPQSYNNALQKVLRKTPVVLQSLLLAVVIWILFQFRSAEIQPFIYFRF